MSQPSETDMIREAVGCFSSAETLQDAVDELMSSGFDRAELSFLAMDKTIEDKLGHKYRKVMELEDDAAAPRRCYVSTESIGDAEGAVIGAPLYVAAVAAAGAVVASGGTFAAVLTAAALAGAVGGMIGSIMAKFIGDQHARNLQAQLERGGFLLWVRTWDAAREKRAVEILSKHSGKDVHVHELPVAT